MKKQHILGIQRMQKLAGIQINEFKDNIFEEFKVTVEPGGIEGEDEDDEVARIQILYYDKKQDEWLDVDENPTLDYLNTYLENNNVWLLNPLEPYTGEGEFYFDTKTHIGDEGQMKYFGETTYEFNNIKELEAFLKNDLMRILSAN
jgi:hypothetical protein